MTSHGYVELPPGWERVSSDGPGPFVTHETFRRPDGSLVRWSSRRHRKRRSTSSWMALGFAIGAACFAVASVASQWASASRPAIGVTFFVGSIFFTAAAYLQYTEAVNAERHPGPRRGRRRLRPASWEPRRIDWLASLTQLAGTLLFNVNCFAAM